MARDKNGNWIPDKPAPGPMSMQERRAKPTMGPSGPAASSAPKPDMSVMPTGAGGTPPPTVSPGASKTTTLAQGVKPGDIAQSVRPSVAPALSAAPMVQGQTPVNNAGNIQTWDEKSQQQIQDAQAERDLQASQDMVTEDTDEWGEYEQGARQMWDDVQNLQKDMLDQSLAGISAKESQYGRRMAEMGAGSPGVGGNFLAGQGQTALYGNQLELGARKEARNKAIDMQMAYLQTLIQQAENAKDDAQVRHLEDLQRQLEYDKLAAEYGVPDEEGGGGITSLTGEEGQTALPGAGGSIDEAAAEQAVQDAIYAGMGMDVNPVTGEPIETPDMKRRLKDNAGTDHDDPDNYDYYF